MLIMQFMLNLKENLEWLKKSQCKSRNEEILANYYNYFMTKGEKNERCCNYWSFPNKIR